MVFNQVTKNNNSNMGNTRSINEYPKPTKWHISLKHEMWKLSKLVMLE